MINVTKTFLPQKDVYQSYLDRIWNSGWITNNGDLCQELEEKIAKFHGVENVILTANGTHSLQLALKILNLRGEVITTPFSYIATSAAAVWENLSPVFVDIDVEHLTIDENKIEDAITEKTSAILATHVFGNPCNVEVIDRIAKKHNLKVIYDAAHCFGVEHKQQSIFNFGDISACSFHATKIFHTAEGGALFTKNLELHNKLAYSANFGHSGNYDYQGLGINAKMSELQAAMGLSIMPSINEILLSRKKAVEIYESLLVFDRLSKMKIREDTKWNYSYFPVIFESEYALLTCLAHLNENDIFPRRYFYPSLNKIEYLNGQHMPISESIAERILCLPLYHDLRHEEITIICNVINKLVVNESLTAHINF
tara:strand:+ start:1047 stop:2153 length:1107 start_codon:yes stop_codon:yes gene_type:complete